jgi:hypothetical protein
MRLPRELSATDRSPSAEAIFPSQCKPHGDSASHPRDRPGTQAQRLDAACGVVGIDDTYVKHRERLTARQFQVTAGRVERNGKLGARFVFVSSHPRWTASLFDGFLLQQGMRGTTSMRVVTDGDDGLRNFVGRGSKMGLMEAGVSRLPSCGIARNAGYRLRFSLGGPTPPYSAQEVVVLW